MTNKILCFFALRGNHWTIKLLAIPKFIQKHNRWPRKPASRRATFEDYVFNRMTGPFTPFERTCVDKETAKQVAVSLSPGVKTARTISVLAIEPTTTLDQLGRFLYPFIGKNLVAKPSHASGGTVFLGSGDINSIVQQTGVLFQLAGSNYFFREYEAQYLGLTPKVIIEECLPAEVLSEPKGGGFQPPPDFRFYSSRGKVLFCQYDEGRFADHRQALFTVPEHEPIPIPNIHKMPDPLPNKPSHWDEMLQRASELSKPFDFVRVDLYDLPDGVYFSEFTFTPNASLFPFREEAFSRKLLADVLKGSRG